MRRTLRARPMHAAIEPHGPEWHVHQKRGPKKGGIKRKKRKKDAAVDAEEAVAEPGRMNRTSHGPTGADA